jgi:hypothetical protein
VVLKVFENKLQKGAESSNLYNFSHAHLEAVTDQLSGILATSDMGNQELEHTTQKPSARKRDLKNPEKYLNKDSETLKKVINNPVFYKDTQHLKIDQ